MLQISNIDNGKSEWNLNETHIIIPVIGGDGINKESDKILTNTLTLSSLDGGDQTILANALENSFVIGLEKNLLETPNYKSDLVIIQNSDLKYSTGQTDLKNSVSYTISYVDQDKSEILFRSPVSKDKIYANDKAFLEVRNVLNYDDSVHELEKDEEQINVNTGITSQVAETNSDIPLEKNISDEKKLHYFNYLPAPQNTEILPIEEGLTVAKPSGNLGLEDKNCPINVKDGCRVEESARGNIYDISKSLIEHNDSQPFNIFECKTNEKKKKIDLNINKGNKVENAEKEKICERGSNSLLEKSLPLKKKAKMKRTLTSFNFDNQKSLLKQDVVAVNCSVDMKFSKGKNIKQAFVSNKFLKNQKGSSDESLKSKLLKQKKTEFKTDSKKLKKNVTSFLPQEDENKLLEFDNSTLEENEIGKTEISGFDKNKINNINDLIDCLRRCRMINATVWQILNSGLKEIKADILKEMNAKKYAKSSPENTSYSPQLKAFALVLYFKQPAAFNYLSQTYKNGWPSLNVIKKWKRRMNSYRRPNFVRIERNIENCNS